MDRVPLELAAHAAGVQRATIRQWVHRGHITRHDDGYDLAELLKWSEARDGRIRSVSRELSHQARGRHQSV